MIDKYVTPLGVGDSLELVDLTQLSDDELAMAGAHLCVVISQRPDLAVNYPKLPEIYNNPKNAAKRLRIVRSMTSTDFIPKLLIRTANGLFLNASGIATAKNAKPGMRHYESKLSKKPEHRLQHVYDKLKTNVTFWCAGEIDVYLAGHMGASNLLQDPIAGILVDAWGRDLEHQRGGVYTLLPQSRGLSSAIDPTEVLLQFGWRGTEVRGASDLANIPTTMEVVVPGWTND